MSLFKRSLCNLQILRASLATYDFILLYADSVNNAMFHVFLDPIKAFKHQALLHIEKGSKETLKMSWTADSYIFLFYREICVQKTGQNTNRDPASII